MYCVFNISISLLELSLSFKEFFSFSLSLSVEIFTISDFISLILTFSPFSSDLSGLKLDFKKASKINLGALFSYSEFTLIAWNLNL